MLLAIDVGNTQTVLGLFSGKKLIRDWRIRTRRGGTADEYGVVVRDLLRDESGRNRPLEAIVVANVVPPLDTVIREMAQTYLNLQPLFVNAENITWIPVRYDEPRDVGADRLVNALAALEEYSPPLIIVDFGTAITFDVINEKGEYIGGAISPGIGISLHALFENAARLQPVDLVRPPSPVGTKTSESIQSGVLYGYASLVDGMVKRISQEIGAQPSVIATGGYASLMSETCSVFTAVDKHLTLKGLCIAYHRLTPKK
jgi:type III pantothenate kinase